MRRHEIPEDPGERINDLLPGPEGDPGVTAQDHRHFVHAVLWIAQTGAPWRDLPERFGLWNAVGKRFERWAQNGVWLRVFEEWKDPDREWLILDSTVIRAHQRAAGAVKTGAPTSRWGGRGAGSAPRCPSPSMASATPSSSS